MKSLVVALLFLLTFGLSATAAWATRYWVALTGSDANPCASVDGDGDPGVYKLTPSSGAACLTVAGDRLTIKNGIFNNAQIYEFTISVANGTAGNPTIIEGEYTVGCAMTHTCGTILNVNNQAIHIEGATYITIRGMEVNGSAQGWTGGCIEFAGTGSNNLVEDVEVHHCGGNGVFTSPNQNFATLRRVNGHNPGQVFSEPRGHNCYLEGSDNLIEYSWFHDAINSTTVACQIFDSSNPHTTDRSVVRYSRFEGSATSDALIITGADVQVYGNLFLNSVRGFTHYAGIAANGGCNSGLKFHNNIVYGNTLAGYVGLFGTCPNGTVDMTNNVIVGNSFATDFQNGWTNTGTNNRTTGTITDVTVSTTDFTHKVGGAGIAAGTTVSTRNCNGTCDLGPFETFNRVSAIVNENNLDTTWGMNLYTPIQLASGNTGVVALFSAVARTSLSIGRLTGTDSVMRTAFNGAVCGGGDTVTDTYVPGTITDSANIGGTMNQKGFGYTAQAVTNGCGTAPPGDPGTPHIHYKLDETSGTNANDESANNLDGTHTNGPTVGVTGKQGFAVSYAVNGNDFTAVPYGSGVNPSSQSLTICMGVLPDAGLETDHRLFFGAPLGTSQRLYLGWYLGYWAQGVQAQSYTTPAPNEFLVSAGWAHVCQVVNSAADTVTMYVNGTAGTSPASVKAITSYSLAGNFQIGQLADFPFEIPGATIDEVKIYTSALSAANISTLYAAWEPPAPPSTGTFTQKRHQFLEARYLPGTTTTVLLGAQQAAINVAIGQSFAIELQTDCTAANCDPLSQRIRYSRNGGPFLQVPDDCANDQICFIGASAAAHPDVLNGTVTCCLTGALTPNNGSTQRTTDAVPIFDLAQNASITHRYVLKLGPSAVLTDTYDLKLYNQTSEPLDVFDPVGGARITVAGGIGAPTNLHFSGPVSNTLAALLWEPVTGNLAGTNIYRSTTSGVYDAVPTYQVSVAASLAAHSSPTQLLMRLPVAATYYFVTKSYDLDGNLSAASSETSRTVAGMSARAARVP